MRLHQNDSGLAKLQGSTLIVATEGPGNVGQLAADLLVSTFAAQRVGWLDDDALLPAMGAGVAGQLAMSLELYHLTSSTKTFLLQQRAPAAPGLQAEFGQRQAAWIASAGFAQVLLLGSLDAMLRRDEQLAGVQLRSWSVDTSLAERCSSCGAPPLEDSWFAERALGEQLLPPWPAAVALQAAGMADAAALVMFAAEGENRGDAQVLAAAAARVAGLDNDAQPQWVQPPSWRWVFGRSQAVY